MNHSIFKVTRLITLVISLVAFNLISAQQVYPEVEYPVCAAPSQNYTVTLSDLNAYAQQQNQGQNLSPEVYVTRAQTGVAKITNLYTTPTVVNVCGDTDGNGGYYDIGIDSNLEIYVARRNGVLSKLNTNTCIYSPIGSMPPNGSSAIALSFDTGDNLYEGGFTSTVFRANAGNYTTFYAWHDFGQGHPAGDFVMIGNYMYVAWVVDNTDYLYKVTVDSDYQYVSHVNLGAIEPSTFGLAAEYGVLYGVTTNYLYKIDLPSLNRTTIIQRFNQANTDNAWWGAAGYHEAINYQFSYYTSLTNAENQTTQINNETYSALPPYVIYVRVDDVNNGTYYIVPIKIMVKPKPVVVDYTDSFCSNDGDSVAINIADYFTHLTSETNVTFTAYESEDNANNAQNAINNNVSITSDKTYYIRIENTAGCFSIAELKFTLISSDNPDFDTQFEICNGSELTIEVPDEYQSYLWSGMHGTDLGQPTNQNSIVVHFVGTYSLQVVTVDGCTIVYEFQVNPMALPVISEVTTNGNTLTVMPVTSGSYEYSTDGINWQTSNIFYNMTDDFYNFYIRYYGEEHCIGAGFPFDRLFIPNVITPNGDGLNDTWNVEGLNNYPEAKMYIFDRYGKTLLQGKLSQILPWNGMYNGNPLPSGSYWYLIQVNENRTLKGAILLKN